jgi:hypothetical protein
VPELLDERAVRDLTGMKNHGYGKDTANFLAKRFRSTEAIRAVEKRP